MKYLIILLTLLSFGCLNTTLIRDTTQASSNKEEKNFHWDIRSFPLTARIDSRMTDCQKDSVAYAIDFIEKKIGVNNLFLTEVIHPSDPVILGLPEYGKIDISSVEMFENENHAGETLPYYIKDTSLMYYAEIKVIGCNNRIMAHELVHALGLTHHKNAKNLMFWLHYSNEFWDLDASQINQIYLKIKF